MNKVLKTTSAALALAGLVAGGSALAQPTAVHYVYAPVVDVEPVYATERVPVEREICWEEREYRRPRGSATGTIAGAIIGGVIGNQFGGGNGKRALTAAGAALGASIGHDASKKHRREGYSYPVQRCEIQVDYESRSYTDGYNVRYEYNGEIFETFTRTQPGDVIKLEVAARPVG